jgi:hypothetical protein
MDIVMPPAFPATAFRAFGQAATKLFPALFSSEALFDPQEKRRNCEWAWQAVRYRYRSCVECQDEFKALLANASEAWRAGWGDEELTYKLERCIYLFFMSALSVFDSFAFSLYYLGHAIEPDAFPDVGNPRKITRKATARAYDAAFPQAQITGLLSVLQNDAGFDAIDTVRNLVGHRTSGRRSIDAAFATRTEWREETWHLPGAAGKLMFDEGMLQRCLDDITRLVTALASAAREFAEGQSAP